MKQRYETPLLVLSLLITVGLLSIRLQSILRLSFWGQDQGPTVISLHESRRSMSDRKSQEERILLTAEATPNKQVDVLAFAKGDWSGAIAHFQSSLQKQRNDPETLIYLNNAQVANRSPHHIAVSVPIGSNLNVALSAPFFNPHTAISETIRSGADALLLTPHVDRLDRVIDLAHANQARLALFGSPTLYTIKTLQAGQADVSGLMLPVIWPGMNSAPFAANAQQQWGGLVNCRTAMAYDATRAVIAGLSQRQTRDGWQQALRDPQFTTVGAGGAGHFLPTGDRAGTPILVKVQASASGRKFLSSGLGEGVMG